MSFKLACPACGSHFSLGADLLGRPLTSNLVSATCPHCGAQIAVDASAPTLPSHQAPRRAPHPPHPRKPNASATGTPLPNDVDDDGSALTTPLRFATRPMARPPQPRAQQATSRESEPELIEAEEIPQSSSDAPTLAVLMSESKPPKPARKPRPADDFLVNLSAGSQGILGAPTIDVTQLASSQLPTTEHAADLPLAGADARRATAPLFDMGAVLKASQTSAVASARDASAIAPERSQLAPGSPGPSPESTARVRKFVVPPTEPTTTDPTTSDASRSRTGVWLGLVATVVSAGAAIVALSSTPRKPEPALAEAPAVHANAALPTDAVTPPAVEEPFAVSSAVSSSSSAPAPKPAPPAANSAPAQQVPAPRAERALSNTGSASPPPAIRTKSEASAGAVNSGSEQATNEPAAANPKPELKTIEAKNAPAPAEPGTEFDPGAARTALASAATQAASCRKEGDPSGMASITITFAPSGRVTSATLQGPPFAGTATGGCIASVMRRATVPAFSGEHVTVTKTIVVE